MATIKQFEEIEAWQKARNLCDAVYKITKHTALARDFRFRDQVNAAAGSVMDNIAEGFERGGKLELIQFLAIAKGSTGEVRSQLFRILDRGYITKEKFDELYHLAFEIGEMLGRWIQYLNQSEHKGAKFKGRI